MATIYKYNSKEDYVYHVKELKKEGFDWYSNASEEVYSDFYYNYSDFILYVYKNGKLTYGSYDELDDEYPEPILYYRKKTNLVNY